MKHASSVVIRPMPLPHATLYAVSAEAEDVRVSLFDARSGRTFHGSLRAGRDARLLVSEQGEVLASDNWHAMD